MENTLPVSTAAGDRRQETLASTSAKSRAPKYDGPVIDVDVHHSPGNSDELVAYLPQSWREMVMGTGVPPVAVITAYLSPGGFRRMDSYPSDGRPPGADYDLLRTQALEPLRVERAILSYNVGFEVAHENPYLAAALASASNDWSLEQWLTDVDDRLYGGLLVGTQLPEEAAKEIRRVGEHPRMVEVLVVDGGLGQPFGHPVYHPIYDAAAEFDLPVAIHFGTNITGALPAFAAGGMPQTTMEYYPLLNQAAMHHATSLITHGVFEKWPRLKVVFLESGCNWVPWLFSQLDAHWDLFRRESPWVKKQPTDYLRENLRFGVQPFEPAEEPRQLIRLLETVPEIENLLLFSTDYPHWDTDELEYVARHLPDQWQAKVSYENAREIYRWPD